MPQYYSGADSVSSFTDGLERGFNLVEGIRERRQLRDLRERESARADASLELQKNQDARAQTSADQNTQEFEARAPYLQTNAQNDASTRNLQSIALIDEMNRRPTDYKQKDDAFASEQAIRAQQLKTGKFAYDNAVEAKAATADYVDNALIPSMGSPLTQVARGQLPGQAPTAPAAQPAPANYVERAPAQVASPAQPGAADLDLRNAPTVGERVGGAIAAPFKAAVNYVDKVSKASDAKRWDDVAEGGILYDAQRKDPARFAGQYLKNRAGVKPENRTKLDFTMKAALNDELNQLPPGPKNAPRIREINDQLKQLDRAQMDSLKTDVRRPVSPSDPKVEQALAPFAPTPGAVPVMTHDQFRALNVQLGRVSDAKKVDGNQLKAIARARKAGVIDDATLNNWRQFGGPLAPAAPKITSVTGGFVAQTPSSYTFVGTADGSGADKQAKASAKGVENLLQSFKGEMAAGRLPGEKNSEYAGVNDLITILQTGNNAQEFEAKTGIKVLSTDGKTIDMSVFSNPVAVKTATDVLARARQGITDSRESALVPAGQEEAVSSMPAAPSNLQPGFVHSSGYTYLGGDPAQPSSWQAPQQ
jgi:hypothetical protein